MSEMDSLELEISAETSKAEKNIDSLCRKLENLSKSITRIDTKGMQKFSSGINMMASGMNKMKDVKMPDFTRTVKGLKKFEELDGKKISTVSNALNPLSASLKNIGNTNFNNKNVNSMVSAIARLTTSLSGNVDVSKLGSIGNGITSLVSSLSSAGKIENSVTRVVGAIARLASAGSKTGMSASGLPLMQKNLESFIKTLAKAPVVDAGTTEITTSIAKLASAGMRTKQTADNLKNLSDKLLLFIKSLQSAPQVSQGTVQLVSAIGNLATAGSKAGTALNGFSGSANRGSKVASFFGNKIKEAASKFSPFNKGTKNMAQVVGLFYAKAWIAIRALKGLGSAIGSAQDYIEEFNYFSVALDKIGKDSAENFADAGYKSAEEYAKSFRTRFSKLQTQMTGFNVDYNTGDLESKMQNNLGLNITKVMNYNAAISQITNSAGMLGETSIMASKALSMLSADWSSLANEDLQTTMDHLRSGMIGMSRAVYSYGIDITKAGLAQTAFNHGVSESVNSMSQNEKIQLRVLTMLEQSKVAYGDIGRTINQPANQLRMLQAGFENLARSIGALFIPVLEKVYPYLNAVVMVLQDFVSWVSKLAGIKMGDLSNSWKMPDYGDAADDMDDYAKSTNKAAKSTKKLADNIQGFDVLNKLQDNSTSDGTKKTNPGNGNDFDLSADIAKALKGYESIWDKAFNSNKNKAVQYAQRIKKEILKGWRKGGDYTEIGKALGTWISNGLSKIPWASIQGTGKKLAKSLATFLNGLIRGTDWVVIGQTIAEGLNTGIGVAYTFLTTFDFLAFGQSIATGLDSAIRRFDWTKTGKLMGAKLRSIITFAFGAISTLKSKNTFNILGEKIGDLINGFFEDMNKVGKSGKSGWQELGESISDGIKGIGDTLIYAMEKVKWDEVGKAIGDFLGSIDWIGILGKTAHVITTALWSLLKTAFYAFKTNPAGMTQTIITVFSAVFAYKKLKGILSIFTSLFSSGIGGGIDGAAPIVQGKFTTMLTSLKGSPKLSAAGTAIGSVMGAAIVEAVAVSWAKSQWQETLSKYSPTEVAEETPLLLKPFSGLGVLLSGEYSASEWVSGIGDMISDKIDLALHGAHYDSKFETTESRVNSRLKELGKLTNGDKRQEEYLADMKKKNRKLYNKMFVDTWDSEGKNVRERRDEYYQKNQIRTAAYKSLKGIRGSEDAESLVSKALTMFKSGQIDYQTYDNLMSKTYKSTAEWNNALDDARTSSKLTNGNVKEFNKYGEKFKKTMDKAGVSTGLTSTALYVLKKRLDKGEISFDQYKKICDKSYKSTKDFYTQLNKIAGKKVTTSIKTEIEGMNQVDDLGRKIDKIAPGVYFKVDADVSEVEGKIKNLTTGKNIKVSASFNTKDLMSKIRKELGGLKGKDGNPLIPTAQLFPTAKQVKSYFNSLIKKGAFDTDMTSKFLKGVKVDKKAKKVRMKRTGITVLDSTSAAPYIAAGYKVEWYKNGGTPPVGQMFMARESGPELVGKVGSQNKVVNNEQIYTGITNAVAPSVYTAVKAAINETIGKMDIGGGDVYLDGKKITTEVMNNATKISKGRGGTSWSMA